jgi:hypothetical protein
MIFDLTGCAEPFDEEDLLLHGDPCQMGLGDGPRPGNGKAGAQDQAPYELEDETSEASSTKGRRRRPAGGSQKAAEQKQQRAEEVSCRRKKGVIGAIPVLFSAVMGFCYSGSERRRRRQRSNDGIKRPGA